LTALSAYAAACGSSDNGGAAPEAGAEADASPSDATSDAPGPADGGSDALANKDSSGSDSSRDAAAPYVPMYIATGYQNRRIVSYDHAATWVNDVSDPPSPDDDIGTGVAFGLGTVIVTGHTGIYTSTDGKNWTHLPPPAPQAVGGGSALFANGTFVAVANWSSWTSTDGVNFTEHGPDDGGAMWGSHWPGLAWGNGVFFAVGDTGNTGGVRKVSADGATWHNYVEDPQWWSDVAFGNGVFVAVGQGGQRVWTTDGVNLNDVSDPSLGDITHVAFGGGQFIVSSATAAASSPDGKTWTTIPSIWGVDSYSEGDGLFLTTAWPCNVLTSPTGLKWTTVFTGEAGSPTLIRAKWGEVKGPASIDSGDAG
jgi:hypothetical protein